MSAASALNRRVALPAAAAGYAGVFTAFYFFETPGLGIGHFFFVPICLVALVTDELRGALAGVFATLAYFLAIELTPRVPAVSAITSTTAIRLLTFTLVGALTGFYASRNRELVERLRDHASRDFLTGLGNARAFDEELARRCASGAPFALMIADVDGLKDVNDVHGHAAGNAVLRRVADALRRHADPDDFVARIGGDEFAIVTSLSREECAALVALVQRTLAAEELAVTIGTTRAPDDGETAAELFHKADDRLFAAKLVRENRAAVLKLAR